MDLKKMMAFLGMLVGVLMLMSASCNKDESDDPSVSCTGFISATASGELNATFCMEALVSYDYIDGESLSLIARQDGEPIYSCTIQLRSYAGPITGVGTYTCGLDEVGYVELDVHGAENEFYKAQSGTITVTQLDATNFQATFNVVTKGYYNGKTLNLSGTAGI